VLGNKIEQEKIRRLAIWASGCEAPPIRIDLEPTFGCNLKCKFCWQRDPYRIGLTNYSRALKEERLIKLVHEAGKMGVLEWQIAGGWEPMIRPAFMMELMRLIKKYNMYGCLTTNGTLFKPEYIEELVRIGWDQILFSLEGSNAEVHDHLTGVDGSFDKSVEAMRLFAYWKKKLRKKQPIYSFHTVLTNRNYNRVGELVKWGADLKTCGVCFEPLNVWSVEGAKLKLNQKQKKEFQALLPEAIKLARTLGVSTNLESLNEGRFIDKEDMDQVLVEDITERGKYAKTLLSAPCFEPWLNLEIRASGHVVECRLNNFQDYAPRLHKKSLKEVWFGDYFNRVRRRMIRGTLPDYCKTCASGIVINTRKLRRDLLSKIDTKTIKELIQR